MTEEQAVVGERSETSAKSPSRLDLVFNVTLVLKGLDGVFEFVGGILLLVISPDSINAWAQRLTQHELSHDPSDFFANHLLRVTSNLHHTQTFGAIYLLSHGIVKLVMVGGLLKRAHWSYYFAFVVLGAFIAYQLYRMTYDPTVSMALLTAFDLFILWMTWLEFRRMRAKRVLDEEVTELV